MPPDAVSYLQGQRTYTEILAQHGYRLGLSSKWHLGGLSQGTSAGAIMSQYDELLGRLTRWFDRYVDPLLDGTRFPVSGSGHRDRIGRRTGGEGCFHDGEFGIAASGFPVVSTD